MPGDLIGQVHRQPRILRKVMHYRDRVDLPGFPVCDYRYKHDGAPETLFERRPRGEALGLIGIREWFGQRSIVIGFVLVCSVSHSTLSLSSSTTDQHLS
jgi:hypothetical protein